MPTLLRWSGVCLGWAMVCACLSGAVRDVAAERAAPRKPGQGGEHTGFVLELVADRKSYMFGDPVKVTATLRNVSRGDAELTGGDPLLSYGWEVTYKDVPCPITLHGAQRVRDAHEYGGSSGVVKEGQSMEAEMSGLYAMNRLFDMTRSGWYTITVTRRLGYPDGRAQSALLWAQVSVQVVDRVEQRE